MTVIKLNDLKNESSPKKNRKRVGRGIGSGKGKTCGRGHKGQKSRTGVSINGFEGGQIPIYRRVPKRGFNNLTRVEFQTINIGDLQKFVDSKKIDPNEEVTRETLYEAGIIKKLSLPLKVLSKGDLRVSLKLNVDAASAQAVKLVEKAGGKVKLPLKDAITKFKTITIGELQKFVDSKKIDPSKEITRQSLFDAGIIENLLLPVKIMSKGGLKASLNLNVDAVSTQAVKLVEKVGGKIKLPESDSNAA